MNVYQIKDWNKDFETNKSRQFDTCRFIYMPRKEGLAFKHIMAEPDGAAIYGIWVLLVGICANQCKPRDGWLTTDGHQPGTKRTPVGHVAGTPLSMGDLVVLLGRQEGEIRRAVNFLALDKIGWLICHTVQSDAVQPVDTELVAEGARKVPDECPQGAREVSEKCSLLRIGLGQDRIGVSLGYTDSACVPGREDGEALPPEPEPSSSDLTFTEDPRPLVPTKFKRSSTRELAGQILDHLNAKTGRQYEKTLTNLDAIAVRIEDVGLDTEGIKSMIDRQCALWLPDERMAQYLRVSTLFNKTKFNEYWSARNMPVINGHPVVDHSKGF